MKKKSKGERVDFFYMSTKGKKLRKFRLIRRIINISCSILLCLSTLAATMLLTGFILSNQRVGGLNTGDTPESGNFAPLKFSTHAGVSYILVLGVDLSESLSDVIAITCFDHEKNTINMLQIPRDIFIGTDVPSMKLNAVYGNPNEGENKINALRRRLAAYFAIPLDHYVVFTIQGFMNAVDAMGGVEVDIKPERGIEIENQFNYKKYTVGPGLVTLDGNMAAGFVRKRFGTKAEGFGKGDTARLENQRIFYAGLANKLKSMALTELSSVGAKCYNEIATDMTLDEIIGYAKETKEVDFENIGMYGVPGQACNYKGTSYYSVHKASYIEIWNTYFNPYGKPINASDIKIRELHTEVGQPTTGSWIGSETIAGLDSE